MRACAKVEEPKPIQPYKIEEKKKDEKAKQPAVVPKPDLSKEPVGKIVEAEMPTPHVSIKNINSSLFCLDDPKSKLLECYRNYYQKKHG